MGFDFGSKIEGEDTQPKVVQRSQLAYPPDQQSEQIIKEVIKKNLSVLNRVQGITLQSGDISFDVRNSDLMSITASASVTIATITNGYDGQFLTLIFNDGNVTITHDNSGDDNTVNLGSEDFTSAQFSTLTLVFDGASWTQTNIADTATRIGIQTPFEHMDDQNSSLSVDNFEVVINVSSGVSDRGGAFSNAVKADITKDVTFEFDLDTGSAWTDAQNVAIFVGLKGSTSMQTSGVHYPVADTGAMTEDHMGFLYYEIAGVLTLTFSTADGTTQNQSSAVSGITITNYNRYRIERVGSTITFYINGASVGTSISNLPDDTTNAIVFMGVGNASTSVQVRQGWKYTEPIS